MTKLSDIEDRIEPGVAAAIWPDATQIVSIVSAESHILLLSLSIAISLKRIADALEDAAIPKRELVWLGVEPRDDSGSGFPALVTYNDMVYFRTPLGDSPAPCRAGEIDWLTSGPGKPTHYARA